MIWELDSSKCYVLFLPPLNQIFCFLIYLVQVVFANEQTDYVLDLRYEIWEGKNVKHEKR